jgi:transcriptional regulator with XRE-family HTH domain
LRREQMATEQDIAVGRAVAAARHAADLGQAEAGRSLRVAPSRIATLEAGSRRLHFVEALELAALYRVKPAAFLADVILEDCDHGPNKTRP